MAPCTPEDPGPGREVGLGALRLDDEGRDADLRGAKEAPRGCRADEPLRAGDLRLVPEEVRRSVEEGAERGGAIHVVDLLGRVERDRTGGGRGGVRAAGGAPRAAG